jgi:hypothetical protein
MNFALSIFFWIWSAFSMYPDPGDNRMRIMKRNTKSCFPRSSLCHNSEYAPYRSILCSLTCHDVISKFGYGLRGFLLAVVVHGEDSDWAELWRDRKLVDEFDVAQLVARWC